MRTMSATDAKARLAELLDDVERGETVVITRHGQAVARLVPEADRRREAARQAIESIKAIRARAGKVTLEEILAARHEGHRY